MSLLSLTLILAGLLAALARAGDTVRLDSLVAQCKFMVDGVEFDLCPALQKQKQEMGWTGAWSVGTLRETPPTVTSDWYRISLDGPLPLNSSKPASMQCPEGTWICMTSWNRNKSETWKEGRLLQTVPVAGSMSLTENDPLVQKGEYKPGVDITARFVPSWNGQNVLSIRLNGGYYVDRPQFAAIHFLCDRDHENAKFSHFHTHDGSHFFQWTTPHACGTMHAVPPPGKGPEGEQDLAPPLSRPLGRGYWTLLLSSAGVIGAIAYLIHSPPRPLRRKLQQYMKDHPSLLRFRVGENVLVRWAHEDVILDDLEDETVVNGDDINYAEEEQIPLKPSPRKTGIVSYGTTKTK